MRAFTDGMRKIPFCCRLRKQTLQIIKKQAKAIGGSQADVIENWANNRTVSVSVMGKTKIITTAGEPVVHQLNTRSYGAIEK